MKPLLDYLIIDPAPEEVSKTEGGLLLTEKQGEVRFRKAVVLKVSDEIKMLKEGDVIYYDRNSGQTLDIDGTDFDVIKLRDVVVVV